MQRYLCYVQYRGTSLSGWQYQQGNHVKTVESVIRDTLDELVGRGHYQSLTGASRTDAGVHALQNAFHIDVLRTKRRKGELAPPFEGSEFKQAFNSISKQHSQEVALVKAVPAPYGMSARFDAIRKTYVYRYNVIVSLVRLLFTSCAWKNSYFAGLYVLIGRINLIRDSGLSLTKIEHG
eukprot:gb/GECG01002777.1/.p1 GENE.gb/GECG01002777.1/~~gb/GECG01002777.1/.p1  ORF type:complete len:179 (+),score=10.72 gb/GECG01002777.1/:1-537(+)